MRQNKLGLPRRTSPFKSWTLSKLNPKPEDFPKELFAETLQLAGMACFGRDLVTGTGFWSDEQFRLFGYEPGEIQPDFPFVVSRIHDEDRADFLKWNQELLQEDIPYDHVFRIIHKDGRSIRVRSRIRVLRNQDGIPIRAFGILQDLSWEAEFDAKLRKSENALKEAQKIAKIGSWSHNMETAEYEWSDEMFRIAGIPRQKITDEVLLGTVFSEDIPRLIEAGKASMEGEEFINIEIRIQRPDGEIRFIQDRWHSIKNAEGKEIRRFGTIQDITEKKTAELERLQLERKILEAEKLESLGLLAGGIAHDFNNLLAGILGNAELLLPTLPQGTKQRDWTEGILRNTEAAAELVKSLLNFAGKRQGKVRPVNMKEVIQNTLSLIQPLIPPSVQLQFEATQPVPPIHGDPLRLRQALMNLLLNGVEAMESKPGDLKIRLQKGSPELHRTPRGGWDKCILWGKELPLTDSVVIEIEDEGEGMTKETLGKIFDPFFTTKFTGHGLGLASTLDIIRSHNGQICIQSRRGKGSLFRILLPWTSQSA